MRKKATSLAAPQFTHYVSLVFQVQILTQYSPTRFEARKII